MGFGCFVLWVPVPGLGLAWFCARVFALSLLLVFAVPVVVVWLFVCLVVCLFIHIFSLARARALHFVHYLLVLLCALT